MISLNLLLHILTSSNTASIPLHANLGPRQLLFLESIQLLLTHQKFPSPLLLLHQRVSAANHFGSTSHVQRIGLHFPRNDKKKKSNHVYYTLAEYSHSTGPSRSSDAVLRKKETTQPKMHLLCPFISSSWPSKPDPPCSI